MSKLHGLRQLPARPVCRVPGNSSGRRHDGKTNKQKEREHLSRFLHDLCTSHSSCDQKGIRRTVELRARRLHSTFDLINQIAKHSSRAPVKLATRTNAT